MKMQSKSNVGKWSEIWWNAYCMNGFDILQLTINSITNPKALIQYKEIIHWGINVGETTWIRWVFIIFCSRAACDNWQPFKELPAKSTTGPNKVTSASATTRQLWRSLTVSIYIMGITRHYIGLLGWHWSEKDGCTHRKVCQTYM